MAATRSSILRRAVLVIPLLICIFLLTDNQTHDGEPPHHLAVVTAFTRHPPSLRVFRSLFEINLLLWCAALALWVWSGTVGTRMVGHLLFQPAPDTNTMAVVNAMIRENGAYSSVGGYGGDLEHHDADDTDQDDDDDDDDDIENGVDGVDGGEDDPSHRHGQSQKRLEPDGVVEDQAAASSSSSPAVASASSSSSPPSQPPQRLPSSLHDGGNDGFTAHPTSMKTTISNNNNNNNNNSISISGNNNGGTKGNAVGNGISMDADADNVNDVIGGSIDDEYDDEIVEALLEEPEPPNPLDLAKAAMNNLLFILITLFLFTISSAEGGKYVDGMADATILHGVAAIAAPVFPLVLFFGSVIQAILPWSRRKDFWKIVYLTTSAPLHNVTFRDGFIGDIITSSVRPMQDICFTCFYLLSGLRGWWEQSYGWDTADRPLENNWILHTWLLPMCVASPLWWRFLQNLRQSYDNKKRWPYLGNALKYFIAAQVALFGIYNPNMKQTSLWLGSFVFATLYQIWWDVFMDWNLFVLVDDTTTSATAAKIGTTSRSIFSSFPRLQFRQRRIYSRTSVYWCIFVINFALRFCWTLSFIPRHYLNKAGILNATFQGDVSAYFNAAIASAEILRRTLWGLLRVENEAVNVSRSNPKLQEASWGFELLRDHDIDDGGAGGIDAGAIDGQKTTTKDAGNSKASPSIGLTSMSVSSGEDTDATIVHANTKTTNGMWMSNDMSMLRDLQILGELSFYAVAFSGLGLLAAYHRDIL